MYSSDDLLKAFAFKPEALVPSAWAGHIPFANFVIRRLKPKTFVELGTHFGASYFAVCQTVKENHLETRTWAVDTWRGEEHAGHYDESVYQTVAQENLKYEAFSTLLRGSFDEALEKFEDGSIELLHIDGFHTYEAVKHDFETWLPKLAPGATVLFHDTNEFRDDFGAYKFWAELMQSYAGFEFKHSHGLGVLQLPGAKVNLIPHESDLAEIRAFFEAAGSVIEQRIFEKLHQNQSPYEQIRKLGKRVYQLENSTSWKITAPLRAISRVFKRG